MIRHVAGIAEIVEDFDAAVRFYRDVLGLEVTEPIGEGYTLVKVPGTLHFGLWSRQSAAEATYGDASEAHRVPLGFAVAFEVDDVDEAARRLADGGADMAHSAKTEPWLQITSRFMSPGGSLCEIASTPWARRISQDVAADGE